MIKIFTRIERRRSSKKFLDEQLRNLYLSTYIVKMIKSRRSIWVGHVACMREKIKPYEVLVGNREGRRPSARPRHKWKENINVDLK
jgi:hypothetical protein